MKSWSLRKKVFALGFLLVFAGAALVSGYLYSNFQSRQVQLQAKTASDLSRDFQSLSLTYEQAGVAVLKYVADSNQSIWDEKLESNKKSEELLAAIKSLATDEDTKAVVTTIEKIYRENLLPVDQKIQEMILSSARDTVFEYYRQEYTPLYEILRTQLKSGRELADNAAATAYENQQKHEKQTAVIMTSALSLGVLAILLILLQSVRTLSQSLGKVASNLTDTGLQTSSISSELQYASQQLSASVSESAASFEETVASIEELSSMVRLNAENAMAAAELSNKSSRSAEHGESEINKLIQSINELAKSSRQIEEITSVIDDISFQTNILALNAAVEAARAGDHGKGFAVVADAVRSLAKRSSEAAKDISKLIQESVTKTDFGVKSANQSGEVLKEIVKSIKRVSALNDQIALASQDQASGLTQINSAMNQLDKATQENSVSANKAAQSSERMSEQAETLNQMVKALKEVVEGRQSVKKDETESQKNAADDSSQAA